MKQEMEAMNNLAKEFFKEADSFFGVKRNVNNAPPEDNAVEELVSESLERDLKSIAINTTYSIYEVKEIYRMFLDVGKVSKIIKASEEIGISAFDVVKSINYFK